MDVLQIESEGSAGGGGLPSLGYLNTERSCRSVFMTSSRSHYSSVY